MPKCDFCKLHNAEVEVFDDTGREYWICCGCDESMDWKIDRD